MAHSGENIRAMAGKVERTEQALRREERALDAGRPLEPWKEAEPVKVFRAKEFVEGGRLKEPTPASRPGTPGTPGTPMVSV